MKEYKCLSIGGDCVNWTISAPSLKDAASVFAGRAFEGEDIVIEHSRGETRFEMVENVSDMYDIRPVRRRFYPRKPLERSKP